MAARPIPMTETTWTVTIDNTFTPSRKAFIVALGDQVDFVNNSGASITIQFEPNPPGPVVSADLSAPNGATAGFVAPNTNASANYYIYSGGVQESGPYAIQVGTGPLYVQVSYSTVHLAGQCTPDPIALPYGGALEMISNDYNYTVTWPNGDPFQGLNSIGVGAPNNSPHTEKLSALLDYRYRVTKTAQGIKEGTGNGGGTVKVRGT